MSEHGLCKACGERPPVSREPRCWKCRRNGVRYPGQKARKGTAVKPEPKRKAWSFSKPVRNPESIPRAPEVEVSLPCGVRCNVTAELAEAMGWKSRESSEVVS